MKGGGGGRGVVTKYLSQSGFRFLLLHSSSPLFDEGMSFFRE